MITRRAVPELQNTNPQELVVHCIDKTISLIVLLFPDAVKTVKSTAFDEDCNELTHWPLRVGAIL